MIYIVDWSKKQLRYSYILKKVGKLRKISEMFLISWTMRQEQNFTQFLFNTHL